jgi:hypothetical protein
MKHKAMKDFLNNLIPWAVFGASILIIVFDGFGILDDIDFITKNFRSLTLVLLATLILYIQHEFSETQERIQCEFRKTQERIDEVKDQFISNFSKYKYWDNTEEGMAYIKGRFKEAKRRISQAATAPSLKPISEYDDYDQTLRNVLENNPSLVYRHALLLDPVRWARVRNHFLFNRKLRKYTARYYHNLEEPTLPGFSYAIIDDTEVIIRYPYALGDNALWMSITDEHVVKLLLGHFEKLWSVAHKIDPSDEDTIDELDERYGYD